MEKLSFAKAAQFGNSAFNKVERAELLYEQLVDRLYAMGEDIAVRVDCPERIADALVKAAQAHVGRRNGYRLAEKALITAYRIVNQVAPAENARIVTIYKLLGHVCCRQGKHREAMKYNALALLLQVNALTGQSRASGSHRSTNESQKGPNASQTNQHQSHYAHSKRPSSTQEKSAQSTTAATGWFKASTLNLTPLQELVQKIDSHCGGESLSFLGMILCFAGAFGPLIIMSSILGTVFPELPGHYPDWMQAMLLFGSGWCSWYIFRWFFSEVELIKLQQKELYFKSNRTLFDTVELAKGAIAKQSRPNAEWKFTTNGTAHEATIEFVEEVIPEVKRARHLSIRLEARPASYAVVLAMEVRAMSPFNSFACKQIAEAVVTELKKELQPIAA